MLRGGKKELQPKLLVHLMNSPPPTPGKQKWSQTPSELNRMRVITPSEAQSTVLALHQFHEISTI